MIHRGGSITAMRPTIQSDEGGSIPTPPLDRRQWRVRPVSLDTTRELVRKYHYSRGGSNTAVYTFGLFPVGALWESDCVGVSWWLPPIKACGASVWPAAPQAVLSLSRLVCTPNAPKNAASFLLAKSMRMIDRARWPVLITFADEWQKHTGAIYLAAGWEQRGFTKPERTYVRDGVMVCRKAGPKTRTHDEMLANGCEYVGAYRRRRFVHLADALGRRREHWAERN